ncbi:penicillin-binding protein activator, partial [Xanthomonas campestris pv. campestris]
MVMLAAGCATSSVTQTASPTQSAALALLDQGKPREAAQQLEAEAASASGAQRSRLLAAAAFGWHDAGDDARARTLLGQVTARHLTGEDRARFDLLTGELAVIDKQAAQALQALGDSPQGLTQPL